MHCIRGKIFGILKSAQLYKQLTSERWIMFVARKCEEMKSLNLDCSWTRPEAWNTKAWHSQSWLAIKQRTTLSSFVMFTIVIFLGMIRLIKSCTVQSLQCAEFKWYSHWKLHSEIFTQTKIYPGYIPANPAWLWDFLRDKLGKRPRAVLWNLN